jgi:bifunctional polynucleotide phosphatase/kinase
MYQYIVIGDEDAVKKAQKKTKYVLLDYDGTIVKPNGRRPFPKDPTDWRYFNESVVSMMRELEKDYRILIFTQQSKNWKIEHIKNSLSSLGLSCIEVFIAWYKRGSNDTAHCKPSTSFYHAAQQFAPTLPSSFPPDTIMVGDAGGRRRDFSDCDKAFADNLGIVYKTPEEFFVVT